MGEAPLPDPIVPHLRIAASSGDRVQEALARQRSRSLFHAPAAVRARILLTYLWRHGRLPNLRNPTLFNELVQVRKLSDRNGLMPLLVDKVRAKEHVAARLGAEWIVPTLWQGTCLPSKPIWVPPFVLKSRHGCKHSAFVRTGREDWATIRRQALRWMRSTYGTWLDEWAYREVERGLLVEPFIGTGDSLPIDYKLFVFGGQVSFVQVHLDREHDHTWQLFDRDWRPLSRNRKAATKPPHSLGAMIDAAEELGRDFDFVRIDFYEVNGRPLFGEATFYPGSGLDPFEPRSLDLRLGREWIAAAAAMPGGSDKVPNASADPLPSS
ncbi:ATP-grasp fold amidoligase family protein [Novosphingobium sp. 9U]|uniref:ATP-grasp fold amidoligase family protein n=1 Tax=Novosphingobium sp. 9U TaxID=2653158 RepID=UPI0012EF2F99|nr:ATP-grasp fold amidoligase family protein [Novosphingobium sp. 9U]VWX47201.1 Polysaccharide biosynthesis protein [Novosphingobium sp. 9U]